MKLIDGDQLIRILRYDWGNDSTMNVLISLVSSYIDKMPDLGEEINKHPMEGNIDGK